MENNKLLVQILRKIPLLNGLSPTYVRKLITLFRSRTLKEGSLLLQSGTPSDSFHILLSGELSVVTAAGTHVTTLKPVTTVGEIGVITDEPRSATVKAARPSRVMTIEKDRFEAILDEDKHLSSRIYRNFIQILADKMANDNIRLRDVQIEKTRFEGRLHTLKRQIEKQEHYNEALLDYIDAQGIAGRDEALEHLDRESGRTPRYILLVDDEPGIRQVLKKALSAFTVLEAANGRQAIEIARKQPPDLVITDIRMPEIDGLALLDNLRQQCPDLPVLGISGYVDPAEIEGHGFDGFLSKPIRMKTFRNLVEAALKRGRRS